MNKNNPIAQHPMAKTTTTSSAFPNQYQVINNPQSFTIPLENQQVNPADLRNLIFLGHVEDVIEIKGFKFVMRTLKGSEENAVWLGLAYLRDESKLLLLRNAILSRAIVSVNNQPLHSLYDGNDPNIQDQEQKTSYVVNSWQQSLIDKLFDFYSELVKRSREEINPEEVKK